MSDLVGNPEDRFSHIAAHLFSSFEISSIRTSPMYKLVCARSGQGFCFI